MSKMKEIPFTQYLMPQGVPTLQYIDRLEEIADKAYELIEAGYRFRSAVDGYMVALAVEELGKDEGLLRRSWPKPVVQETVHNGPEILGAVDRIIEAAYQQIVGVV